MYLRHTTRCKDGKTHVYWQLVRSVRRGRKVVQETVAQLGELDAEGRTKLSPGMCAGFKAGTRNGHRLVNETGEEGRLPGSG